MTPPPEIAKPAVLKKPFLRRQEWEGECGLRGAAIVLAKKKSVDIILILYH